MGAVKLYEQQPPLVDAVPVLSLNSLPLGFRFRPTDEELIDFYLRQKINGNGDDVWVIREIDICKWEPWDLPDLSVVRNKDPEWFFFCPLDRKYPNGHRLKRATTHGYWKATGKDRKIKSGSTLIGMKKTLVFYIGRAPKGKRTHWVMHEYRPTLKELDGTNPGQNPYVLCRLFKKQDDSLESSNCDEVERTTSTPTTTNYSPEEIQSDPTQNPVSSSQATEDDKQLAVITENFEEAISNIITPVDCRSDGFGAQNKTVPVEPPMEDDQQLNLDIFCNPNEQLDDKLFSPINVHIPSEFHYQSNNESNGQHGLQDQYGTNEISISDFFDSYVDWDDIPNGESSSQMPNSTWFDVKGNGSWGDSNVAMTDLMHLQAFDAAYPGEAIDTKIPSVTTKEFHAMTFDRSCNELRSDIGLFENLPLMSFSTDVSMGQLYNAANDYQQPRNINTFVDGETGIRIRTRPQRQEPDVNTVMQLQGTAKRRIQLGGLVAHSHGSDEDPDSKPATAGETKVSEDHAAVESESVTSDVDEPEETSPEVSDSDETVSCVSEDHPSEDDNSEPTTARERNVSEDHASSESSTVTNDADEPEEISRMLAASRRRRIGRRKVAKAKAESYSGLKDSLLSRGVSYTSKASSNLGISVLAVSATVVVLLGVVLLVNPWGYLKV